MPTALALSPHLDDAVFSCGGLIGRLADAGWHVVVATMFTRSMPNPQGFALACQLDKGIGRETDYMALRRNEDRVACAMLGAMQHWLDFAEAPHRGYGSAAALFDAPLADDDADRLLAPEIRRLAAELRPDLWLAPQCVGGHVDHLMTWRALHTVSPAAPTLWWRDFPYDLRPGHVVEPFACEMEALGETRVRFETERKQRACEAYETQLSFQFGGKAGVARMIAAAGGSERFRTHSTVLACLTHLLEQHS